MAYTNSTANMKLPIWLGSDKPAMADFNGAFTTLDSDGQPAIYGSGETFQEVMKYANGLMIIRGEVLNSTSVWKTYTSSLSYSSAFTIHFDESFVNSPAVCMSCSGPGMSGAQTAPNTYPSTSTMQYVITNPSIISDNTDFRVFYIAVGRWK